MYGYAKKGRFVNTDNLKEVIDTTFNSLEELDSPLVDTYIESLRWDESKELDRAYEEDFVHKHLITTSMNASTIITDPRIQELTNLIISEVISLKTTDIMFTVEEKYGLVKYELRDNEPLPARIVAKNAMMGVIYYIRSLAGLEPDAVQNTSIDIGLEYEYDGIKYMLRGATAPSRYGATANLRVNYTDNFDKGIDELNFADKIEWAYKQNIHKDRGMILLTGGTGSGKTTTLYAGIQQRLIDSNYSLQILTAEMPVETKIEGVAQSAISMELGYTWEKAIQSMLRLKPNIILLGEMNDKETAKAAARGAASGHLLFSTIHANSALEVDNALMQLGLSEREISLALNLVIYQHLEPKLCSCKKQRRLEPDELTFLKRELMTDVDFPFAYERNPEGCHLCEGTGFSSERLLIAEMLQSNMTYRSLKRQFGEDYDKLKRALISTEGAVYYPFEEDLQRFLLSGDIDFDNAAKLLGR